MPAFKVRKNSLFVEQVRVGSSGSYTQLESDGRQTMVGAAKIYKDIWLPATVWYGIEPDAWVNPWNAAQTSNTCTPIVRPMDMNFGSAAASPAYLPVISSCVAENKDARLATSFIAPTDAATTGSIECKLFFTSKNEMTSTGCMQVFRVHYQYLGTSGSPNLADSGSVLYGGSMATSGCSALEIWDLGDMPSFSSTSPFVLVQLTLEGSNASAHAGSPEVDIFGLKLRYVSDNLGSQV